MARAAGDQCLRVSAGCQMQKSANLPQLGGIVLIMFGSELQESIDRCFGLKEMEAMGVDSRGVNVEDAACTDGRPNGG